MTERSLIRFADSEKAVKPGEIIPVDNQGRVMTKRRRVRRTVVILGGGVALWTYAIIATSSTAMFWAFPFAVAYGAAFAIWRRYRIIPLVRAHARMLTGDLAGAEALLAAAPNPRGGVGAMLRANTEAWLAYARGRNDEAIACFARGIAQTPRSNVQFLIMKCGVAQSLARSGQLVSAREQRAAMRVPAKADTVIELMVAGVDLAIAFAAQDATVFEEATIDRWVRLALEANDRRSMLALLAWTVASRGDDDLADHLAREAVDRFSWCPLSSWPELDAWIRDRIARNA